MAPVHPLHCQTGDQRAKLVGSHLFIKNRTTVAIALPRCSLPVCWAAMYLKFTGRLEELPRDSVHGYPFIMPATSVTACLFLWLFASCMGRKNCCLCSHCTTDSFITGLFCAFLGLGDHFYKRRPRKWSTELFQQLLLF